MSDGRQGTVLLEVLVALTILIMSGVSTVSLLSASLGSAATLAQREASMQEADRVLAGLTLLTRTDLDRRIGRHPVGGFVAEVRRPEPLLYRIALHQADSSAVELLVTVVYRPEDRSP
jgi:hypothetical protein